MGAIFRITNEAKCTCGGPEVTVSSCGDLDKGLRGAVVKDTQENIFSHVHVKFKDE